MKKSIFRIIIILLFIVSILYISLIVLKNNIPIRDNENNSKLVHVKAFINSDCDTCTKVDTYLEVYKKAWVKFEVINIKEYLSDDYKANINGYNITKLPFLVFSKELSNYKTIANSWKDVFGYKNEKWEFIPTDIVPPYFDLKTKKIEWLIDITYIWDNVCTNCYTVDDIISILSNFWLRFQNIKQMNKESKKAIEFIEKYKINTFPVVLLSTNTSLYKNFSYFWQTLWSVEEDGIYILREPWKFGLNISD